LAYTARSLVAARGLPSDGAFAARITTRETDRCRSERGGGLRDRIEQIVVDVLGMGTAGDVAA